MSNAGTGGDVSTLCLFVGLNEAATNNSFLVYPNPSTGSFKITLAETTDPRQVGVFDVNGTSLLKETIRQTGKVEINLEDVAAGIYLIKVFNGETNTFSKIIVLQD